MGMGKMERIIPRAWMPGLDRLNTPIAGMQIQTWAPDPPWLARNGTPSFDPFYVETWVDSTVFCRARESSNDPRSAA